MASKLEKLCYGFHHSRVVDFINEKMLQHAKGSEFYFENLALPWKEVEDKLRLILEDDTVPMEAKEACTWSGLALGMNFAQRQRELHLRRVQWLQDFTKLYKSAAQALASNLQEATEQREAERKEAALILQQTKASLAEMEKERDLLKWKLSQVELEVFQKRDDNRTDQATSKETVEGKAGGRKEKAAGTAAAGATGQGRGEDCVESGDMGGGLVPRPVNVDKNSVKVGRKRKGKPKTSGPAVVNFSDPLRPKSKDSVSSVSAQCPAPFMPNGPVSLLPVQLPASFTYSYPLTSFPGESSPSPPAVAATPKTSFPWRSCDIRLLSDVEAAEIDPFKSERERRGPNARWQTKPSSFRRAGDWDCPWCKAVNFSRRETCYLCGRGIWLQSRQ